MEASMIITCALSSTVAVAIITSIKEIVIWKLNRRAKLQDTDSENINRVCSIEDKMNDYDHSIKKLFELLTQIESKLDISMNSNRVILKDRIKVIALQYLRNGEISLEDKHNLKEMWNIYHYDLGGNGDLDDIMEMIEELPLTDIQ